jgi:hypothetical protein
MISSYFNRAFEAGLHSKQQSLQEAVHVYVVIIVAVCGYSSQNLGGQIIIASPLFVYFLGYLQMETFY